MDDKRSGSSLYMGIAAALLLCLFPILCTSYTSITEFKKNSFLILTGIVLILWFFAVVFEKKKPVMNGRFILGLLYFVGVTASAMFGSYRNILNDAGKPVVLYGMFRGDSLLITTCYAVVFWCFSSIYFRKENLIPFCGEAVLLHFLVVALQFTGINILNLFPESASVKTDYVFQGTLGNIALTPGYIALMVPILFLPYLWNWGKLRSFSLVCGLLGICTVLVSRVNTGKMVVYAILAGIFILNLLHPEIAQRGFLLTAGIFFLLAGSNCVGLPWFTGKESFVFSVFAPVKTTIFLFCGIMSLLLSLAIYKKRIILFQVRKRTILITLIIVMTLCLYVIRIIPFTSRNGAIWEAHEILSGRERDSFGHGRWGVWKRSIRLAEKEWLFGTGPDTFYYALRDYLIQEGKDLSLHKQFDFAHNAYLHVLVCNGFVTAAAYVLLNVVLIVHAFQTRQPFGIMCGLSLICYCIFEFFTFSIFIVAPMAWTIRGIIAGMAKPKSVKKRIVDVNSSDNGMRLNKQRV